MINKDIQRHLIPIGSRNTDVTKIFNVGKHLVARCVKHHGLKNILRDPEYDNVIL